MVNRVGLLRYVRVVLAVFLARCLRSAYTRCVDYFRGMLLVNATDRARLLMERIACISLSSVPLDYIASGNSRVVDGNLLVSLFRHRPHSVSVGRLLSLHSMPFLSVATAW